MSGPDAIQGFIYQTIIAVLDSLQNEWKTILIEPKGKDKIDIFWTDENGTETVYQVKSSKNNFEKSKILDWILGLYENHSTAKEYRVILIGHSNQKTTSFFNNIKNQNNNEFAGRHINLYSIREKIKVNFYPPDQAVIIDAIITGLERFLVSQGKTTDLPLRELIAKALLTDFLQLSAKSQVLTKAQFESDLLKWIKAKFPKIDNLRLAFYLTNKIPFSVTLTAIRIQDIINHEYVMVKKRELLSLIDTIESYSQFSFSRLDKNKQPVSEYFQKIIKNRTLKYINRELNDTFFNFGGLEKTNEITNFPPFYKIEYLGSNDEKTKMKFFDDFECQLENLHDLFRFWKKIQQFYYLPIVLRNEGNTYQKGIKIQLSIPKNIKVIVPSDFPIPKRNELIKELNQLDSALMHCFKHFKDSIVNESFTEKHLYPGFSERLENNKIISIQFGDDTELQKERYYDVLDYYFDFRILDDQEERIVIECEIEELKANEAVSLPSFIFFKSKEDFSIEYEINSNNLPQKINGILNVKMEIE